MALEDPSTDQAGEQDTAPAAPTAPAPLLQEFTDNFSHPAAQDWANEATTRLNDYFQQRQLVDDAQKQGQQFVTNLDQFKSGLSNMVTSDPSAVHVAMDLVPSTVGALLGNMPNQPDNIEDHHAALTGHIQSEIAAAAVTSAAGTSEPLARNLLDNERIQGVLGPDAHASLTNYTDMQAQARTADANAAAGQLAMNKELLADQGARNYIGALVGPTGPRSPDGWTQAVIADNKIPPQTKVDLVNLHQRLGENGDVNTDPHALMAMVGQLASGQANQRALYPAIGNNLSLKDAGMLAVSSQDPEHIQNFHNTLQAAAAQFSPHGDIAETRALGRFVSWLSPQVQRGAILDPQHPDWVMNGINPGNFRVTGEDLVPSTPGGGRKPLGQIFAEGMPTNPDTGRPMTPQDMMKRAGPRGAPVPLMPANPATGLPMTPQDMMSEAAKRAG